MSDFSQRLHELMLQNGYTQRELASVIGVTESAMSRYLKGDREPKIDTIANLATALNTTSDYLIFGISKEDDFSEIYRLVARSTSAMSNEEKMKLMKVLIDK